MNTENKSLQAEVKNGTSLVINRCEGMRDVGTNIDPLADDLHVDVDFVLEVEPMDEYHSMG